MQTQSPPSIRIYQQVARAIEFIQTHARDQPELDTVARAVGMSPYHFQRLFAQWAGLSPKRFLQVLTRDHARALLREHGSTLDIAYEVGLSSPSRLHDLMISCEAMTPGEIRAQGAGQTLHYGSAVSPFGMILIGWSDRGVCHLSFEDEIEEDGSAGKSDQAARTPSAPVARSPDLRQLRLGELLPAARWIEDSEAAQALADRIFAGFACRRSLAGQSVSHVFHHPGDPHGADNPARPGRIHLLLKGTNFQVKVWEALIRLGDRPLVSYQQLARSLGQPGAQRAVASAVGSNPVAWLIPCHRVIRQHGEFGQYRWGATRKQVMLGWEMSRCAQQQTIAP